MTNRANAVNSAFSYFLAFVLGGMMLFMIVCMFIVPGKIAEWRLISPREPTAWMQFMIDAADSGKQRWFIVFPLLTFCMVASIAMGRRLRRL